MKNVDRYWMVHAPGNGAPYKAHKTRESAENEANRLAAQHPDRLFIILKAVKAVKAKQPEIETLKLVNHGECGSGTCDCLA